MGVAYKPSSVYYTPSHYRPLKLAAVSKAMPTLKVSLYRPSLVHLAAKPQDVVHQCSCSQNMKTVVHESIIFERLKIHGIHKIKDFALFALFALYQLQLRKFNGI